MPAGLSHEVELESLLFEVQSFSAVAHAIAATTTATTGVQGQRYDTLRGMAPRATTPNLPPPIRVEQMPDPAPTLPLTLDDLLADSASSAAGRHTTSARPVARTTKPLEQSKPTPTPTPIVPQITVRAVAVRAK